MIYGIARHGKKIAYKNEELKVEKRRTEKLLFQMLPKTVAESLKNNSAVNAEIYDSVTIYFSQVIGFTDICARSNPYQVVEFLNNLYILFDDIIEKYEVYKVETINDAYMVAGGVPVHIGYRHLSEVASMAIQLLRAANRFQISHIPDEQVRLRTGVHTGSVVAGVVGTTMPRYCLFGDTVNTTSRIESTGTAMKIHASEEFYKTINSFPEMMENFFLEPRKHMVTLKGKGTVQTYWLSGIDADTDSVSYNARFADDIIEEHH